MRPIVIKRDGEKVQFDINKISGAMLKAYNSVHGYSPDNTEYQSIALEDALSITNSIDYMHIDQISVEEIQDMVEEFLMKNRSAKVARAYVTYREKHNIEREKNSTVVKKVLTKVNAENVVNSNANVDERSFSGREKEASSEMSKTIALDYGGLDEEVAQAHKDMIVYQHDNEKSIYGIHNCLNLNFQEIFGNGFKTKNGDVRQPKSFATATQLVAVAFQCQSQVQFGGVGTIHIDFDLAPFVKMSFVKAYVLNIVKFYSHTLSMLDIEHMSTEEIEDWVEDNKENHLAIMGYKEEDIYLDNKKNLDKVMYNASYIDLVFEMKQACQALYHNLNTLESRQGSQVPFTSINLGRDTSTEGRLVTRFIFEASLNGIGKFHRTSIFPISIFQHKRGCNANPGDPNYDLKQLALKSLSKRIYPNFVNCDWVEAHETERDIDTYFSTMGKCKLQLI